MIIFLFIFSLQEAVFVCVLASVFFIWSTHLFTFSATLLLLSSSVSLSNFGWISSVFNHGCHEQDHWIRAAGYSWGGHLQIREGDSREAGRADFCLWIQRKNSEFLCKQLSWTFGKTMFVLSDVLVLWMRFRLIQTVYSDSVFLTKLRVRLYGYFCVIVKLFPIYAYVLPNNCIFQKLKFAMPPHRKRDWTVVL